MSAIISHAEEIAAFIKDQAVGPRAVAVAARGALEEVEDGFSPGAAGQGRGLQFEDGATTAVVTLDTAGVSCAIKISSAVGDESLFGVSAVSSASLEAVDHGLGPGATWRRRRGELKDGAAAGRKRSRAGSGAAAGHGRAIELAFHFDQAGGGGCAVSAAGGGVK